MATRSAPEGALSSIEGREGARNGHAASPEELARELRFLRSLRESSSLPPIPPSLLTLESEIQAGAIDVSRVRPGWLHLWSPLERWPGELRETYRQDLLAVFPAQRKRATSGLDEVVLCLAILRCSRKGFRLEERSCPFYCRGICGLGTLQRRADEPDPALSLTSVGYYMGISRQRASKYLAQAQAFLEKELRTKRGFGELCPPAHAEKETFPSRE
ncbi:hypothetical protein [Methylacidimicrobium sp. B4]|uniref:hypothetical protein n=1 Tax=Methylacidimicrobium sp. B4 TaxID=2796139 RepID=UPI001A8E5BB0|nr:hypothetical protein [Methylacidimicrobium sp. B4]QSR85021.1 hypothetical protein MacB4_01765 [Methylacidimicrobium sp. B4]